MTSQDPNDRREEGGRPAAESEQPTVQSPAPRRLYRARQDRVIRGVAGGLGHYFDVDPIIFRIAFVALTFFGGAGIFLYLAFWLFVPTEGEAGAGPRPPSRAVTVIGVVVLVIAAIALLDPWGPNDGGWGWGWWWGGFLFPTVLIAIVGVLLWRYFEGRRQGGGRAGMARAESAEGTTTTVSATGSESTASGMNATWLAGRIALVVAIIAGATFLFFGSAIAAAAGGGVAVAAIVVAIGAMLIVAAFNGGARWLIVPALLMAFPVGVVSAADVRLDGGVGEREYHPTTVTDVRDHYELGMGRLEIDLREAKLPKGDTALDLDLGVGGAAVVVPRDVCVALDAKVGAGYARLLDRDSAGLDVDWSVQPEAPRGVPRLLIDAEVGMGAVQVIHDPGDLDEIDSGGGNDACVRAP